MRKSIKMMDCVFSARMGIQCQDINALWLRSLIIDVISMKIKKSVMCAGIIMWRRMGFAIYPINQLIHQFLLQTPLLKETIIMVNLGELVELEQQPSQQQSLVIAKSITLKSRINVWSASTVIFQKMASVNKYPPSVMVIMSKLDNVSAANTI